MMRLILLVLPLVVNFMKKHLPSLRNLMSIHLLFRYGSGKHLNCVVSDLILSNLVLPDHMIVNISLMF